MAFIREDDIYMKTSPHFRWDAYKSGRDRKTLYLKDSEIQTCAFHAQGREPTLIKDGEEGIPKRPCEWLPVWS